MKAFLTEHNTKQALLVAQCEACRQTCVRISQGSADCCHIIAGKVGIIILTDDRYMTARQQITLCQLRFEDMRMIK